MTTHARNLAVVLIAGGAVVLASAQQPAQSLLQQQKRIDEKLEQQRLDAAPLDAAMDWQWGGWIEYYSFHLDDGVQSSRLYQRPALGLWTRLTLDGDIHEFFARMKMTYNYFEPGDEYDRRADLEGPNLDRLWYRVDLGRAFRLTTPADPVQLELKLGRQEVIWGTGLVLDQVLDGIIVNTKIFDFRVRALMSRSAGTPPNIDRSEPVDSDSRRRFWGIEVTYEGLEDHRPFGYALWNDDFTIERPTDPFQNYAYDTQYWGFGSRGQVVHNLNYWTEWVFETGESYGRNRVFRRDTVNAWAWDIGLEYLFDAPMRPRIEFEYMFASGDGHRSNPTSAAGGNTRGLDSSFAAFGYRDTGISAAPVLSNIHIWKVGGSLFPLERYEFFRQMELGTNWFLYHKNQSSGGISDITADRPNGFVGWEMDYYVNWRLSSDLAWTTRWGVFFPGDAYSERDCRHFVFTGLTWSF